MQLSDLPARIITAFATSGAKNTIPQTTATPGAAAYDTGFPALTMQPLTSGGIPPAGQDFNGILYALSLIQRWQAAGGGFTYDSAWSTANNGYPKGAVLMRADGTGLWLNQSDNNTADPDSGNPSGWVPGANFGITAITGLTNANVTPTNAQAAKSTITLAGTLTGNIQIILPTWSGMQWTVVDNTSGAFTVTVKTSAGTGVVLDHLGFPQNVMCDGTNIVSANATGRLLARRVFTSSGTYTPTPGTRFVDVLVQGGGGGGGGCNTTGAGEVAAGAGGGGGGWAIKRLTVAQASGATMTVGAGGLGVAGAAGQNGGTTSFGGLVSASGGGGGSVGPNSTTVGTPQGSGTPGVGSGGDLNFRGGLGWYAFYSAGSPTSGAGGTSYFGAGAPWVTGSGVNGINAAVFGAGASGSSSGASINGFSISGGVGGAGYIIVLEYA